MGRISRHKKIKSCDPFHKGPNKITNEKISKKSVLAEKKMLKDEQGIPRGMRDLISRAKVLASKKKKKKKEGKQALTIEQKKKAVLKSKFQRKVGEGKREFFNRIDHEAAMAVAESMKTNRKMSDRRKNHLKQRRKKMKQKRLQKMSADELDFSKFKDETKFGEVVQEPPSLTAKPRKAKQENQGTKGLLLNKMLTNTSKESDSPAIKREISNTELPKAKRRKHMSPAEKAMMDKEREKAISAYRISKMKKT
ncbi:coiled-coil domain-containing protein 137 [Nematostella vectensis]|uniref:coiled-coil domain-containing protein 137 n=1 Tax=Nematostella vectensis TaxID=45351 RepID=UPI002077469E|nr:coiled-coil domain-containing protein 137 [Nematostella vectensis]